MRKLWQLYPHITLCLQYSATLTVLDISLRRWKWKKMSFHLGARLIVESKWGQMAAGWLSFVWLWLWFCLIHFKFRITMMKKRTGVTDLKGKGRTNCSGCYEFLMDLLVIFSICEIPCSQGSWGRCSLDQAKVMNCCLYSIMICYFHVSKPKIDQSTT